MENRKPDQLLNLRPIIPQAETEAAKTEEIFQNSTLRPIIKFQHELLMEVVKAHPHHWMALKRSDTKDVLLRTAKGVLQKDIAFRQLMVGCVIGLMTQDELASYLPSANAYNKRIGQMIAQRIADTFSKEWGLSA